MSLSRIRYLEVINEDKKLSIDDGIDEIWTKIKLEMLEATVIHDLGAGIILVTYPRFNSVRWYPTDTQNR